MAADEKWGYKCLRREYLCEIVRKEKETEGIQVGKEEVKFLADGMILYVDNSKEFMHTYKPIRTNKWISQGCRVQGQYAKASGISLY